MPAPFCDAIEEGCLLTRYTNESVIAHNEYDGTHSACAVGAALFAKREMDWVYWLPALDLAHAYWPHLAHYYKCEGYGNDLISYFTELLASYQDRQKAAKFFRPLEEEMYREYYKLDERREVPAIVKCLEYNEADVILV